MSRGPGNIQRRLLSLIESQGDTLHSTYDLAAGAYDVRPNADGQRLLTEAQVSSVRRALTSLAKQGKITGRRGWHDRRQRWATSAVWARYDEDREAWRHTDHPHHWMTLSEPRQRG